MKKRNKKHISLQAFIISLISAVALWVVVGLVNDPDITNKIVSLPISYLGVEELEARGLTLIAPEEKTASSVTISGKRRDLLNHREDIFIYVDVSGITLPGEYSLKGATQISDNRISIAKERIGEIDVVVDETAKKELPVEIKQTGTLKDKLVKAVPQISKISVSGAQSEIDDATKIIATIDISKTTESATIYTDFKICDESGAALTRHRTLTPAIDKIPVDLTLYDQKVLPIKLRLSDEFKGKYCIDLENSSLSTTTVTVGAEPDNTVDCIYADIDKIEAVASDFRLIAEDGIYIPAESAVIKVTPKVLPITSRHMDIPVRMEKLKEGLRADFSDTLTGVVVNAPAETLDAAAFYLILDLDGLDVGTYHIKAKVSDYKVSIPEEIFVDVVIH